MSDRKHDERLVELMAEFLDTEDENSEEANVVEYPGLDNEKMLIAIEKHRSEIDALKKQINDLKETVKKTAKEKTKNQSQIEAPEIIALQSAVSNHSEQITEILNKHDNNADNQEKNAKLEDLHHLKNQVEELKKEIKKRPVETTEPAAVRPIAPLEIIAVQNAVTNHSTKIGDLEYKHKMLKTDMEREQGKKHKGFGMFGWFLVASNVLLWSVLAYFFWKKSESTQSDIADLSIENARLDKVTVASKQGGDPHEIFADTVKSLPVQVVTKKINNSNQHVQSAVTPEKDKVSDTEVLTAKKKEAIITKTIVAPKPIINKAKKAIPVKSKRGVKKASQRKTQAQQYAERMAATKKAEAENFATKKSKPVVKDEKNIVNRAKPVTNEPDVQFGD